MRTHIYFVFFLLFFFHNSFSQDAQNRSVQVSVEIQENPPRFDFSWPWDWSEGGYAIYKKALNETTWGEPVDSLPWGTTEWSDSNIEVGVGYEYGFFKQKQTILNWDIEVPSGSDLTFTIENSNGSGLCCNFGFGWYEVEVCGEMVAEGSDFGFVEETDFQVCNSGNTQQLTIRMLPDLLTNITRWQLANSSTGEVLADSGPWGTTLVSKPKFGVIYAAIDLPATEFRGSILLVVDDEYLTALTDEIEGLKLDLIKDGWRVITRSANRNEDVKTIKNKILKVYNETPDLKSLYLLGHIPVPYSGNYYADGHSGNHWGAWVADTYYGELNGDWTDEFVNNSSALQPWNHNIPNDGNFDQSGIPTEMELQVGRVDLTNLPAFSENDIELTRNYLNKAHLFKTGGMNVPRRGLIDNHLGVVLGAPAASGFRNFAPLFGAENIIEGDYFTTLQNQSFLFSYGGGGGTHISADGIGNTFDFAENSLKTVFTMLFGSQFGDWDNQNNFLRAPLAQGMTLTNVWAGNPPWFFHHMALGFPIGYSTIRTQNASYDDYLSGPQLVHTNLMGDPSLRLHPVKPPLNFKADTIGNAIQLSWETPNEDNILGYYLYELDSNLDNIAKIHNGIITDNSFLISEPDEGEHYFMVKTIKKETSGSGSYKNLSLGEITFIETEEIVSIEQINPIEIDIYPIPSKGRIFIRNISHNELKIKVLNELGTLVYSDIISGEINEIELESGVYFIELRGEKVLKNEKVIVIK